MDVILNRSSFPNLPKGVNNNSSPIHGVPKGVANSGKKAGVQAVPGCNDRVAMVTSYFREDSDDVNNFKFQTIIMFLTQSGVFYCAREHHSADVGALKTLVALDMSWLCLSRLANEQGGRDLHLRSRGLCQAIPFRGKVIYFCEVTKA